MQLWPWEKTQAFELGQSSSFTFLCPARTTYPPADIKYEENAKAISCYHDFCELSMFLHSFDLIRRMKLKLVYTLLCYVLVSAFHLPQHPLGDISGWSPFPFPGRKLLKESDLEKRNEVSIAQYSPSVLIISKKVMRKLLDLVQMNGAIEKSRVEVSSECSGA